MDHASASLDTVQRSRSWSRLGLLCAVVLLGGGALLCGLLANRPAATHNRPARPQSGAGTAAGVSSPDGPIPPTIQTTVHRGPLAITLRVAPVDVGPVRLVLSLARGTRPISGARVDLALSMPSQPAFGVTRLRMTPCTAGYCGQGSFSALGRWHVALQIHLPRLARGRVMLLRVPFNVLNGANARFLFAQPPDTRLGPATVQLMRIADGSSVLTVRLRPHLTVRAVLDMPNMRSMGSAVYAATAQSGGRYAVSLAFPMAGVTQIVLQARGRAGWRPVRTLLYDVGSNGAATLITTTREGPTPAQ